MATKRYSKRTQKRTYRRRKNQRRTKNRRIKNRMQKKEADEGLPLPKNNVKTLNYFNEFIGFVQWRDNSYWRR